MSSRDPSIADFTKLLMKSGCVSRATHALQLHPEGLTLSEIAEVTGLSECTLRNKVTPKLFHAQLAEKIPTDDEKKPRIRLKGGLSIVHDASDRRRS